MEEIEIGKTLIGLILGEVKGMADGDGGASILMMMRGGGVLTNGDRRTDGW